MNKFAIFIITHERADKQITLRNLINLGYTGEYFLVVDNRDTQLDQYKTLYDNHVIVFDKDDYIGKVDSFDNFGLYNTALYPRCFCQDYAIRNGYETYAVADDDLQGFKNVYTKYDDRYGRETMKSRPLKVNESFTAISNFLKCHDSIYAVGLIDANALFPYSPESFARGSLREARNFVFYHTKRLINWRAFRTEDTIAALSHNSRGKIFISLSFASFAMPPRGSNKGGLHEDYKNAGMFVCNFYGVMSTPVYSKVSVKDRGITLRKKLSEASVKIIEEKYKK